MAQGLWGERTMMCDGDYCVAPEMGGGRRTDHGAGLPPYLSPSSLRAYG